MLNFLEDAIVWVEHFAGEDEGGMGVALGRVFREWIEEPQFRTAEQFDVYLGDALSGDPGAGELEEVREIRAAATDDDTRTFLVRVSQIVFFDVEVTAANRLAASDAATAIGWNKLQGQLDARFNLGPIKVVDLTEAVPA